MKITAPFFYTETKKWYFPGDVVEGAAAGAAKLHGCAVDLDALKMPGSVTETKVEDAEGFEHGPSTELDEE